MNPGSNNNKSLGIISALEWQNSSFRPPAIVAFIHHLIADIEKNKAPVPVVPTLTKKLFEMCEQEDYAVSNIADLISMDFSLGRKMIAYANWRYPEEQPTESVLNAVQRIGVKKVRNIALSRHLNAFMTHYHAGCVMERAKQTMQYSLRCAAISEILARQKSTIDADDAQLAGLIALVGMFPILSRYDQHPELLHDLGMLDRVMVYDHAKVGHALLRHWGVAQTYCNIPVLAADLGKESYGDVDLSDVVSVANLHAHLGKQHPLARIDWKTVPAVAKMKTSPQETLQVIQKVKAKIEDIEFIINN